MHDLTKQEETNVRTALRFLRTRCGGWEPLAKAMGLDVTTLRHAATDRPVTASLTFRVARLAKVGVDDVLTGRYPAPGTCPHCGRLPDG